jgi:VIT1/CCC1 family predicted Fe2+/Mn2+ transporter
VGCNLAWGIIDGVMYVMTCMFERARVVRLHEKILAVDDEPRAMELVAGELDERLAPISDHRARLAFYGDIVRTVRATEPGRVRITREDVFGGIASFWLVFITALPAVIPFLIIDDPVRALRASNTLLIAMLFLVGYAWGKRVNDRPWAVGLSMTMFGVILVLVAIRLGG